MKILMKRPNLTLDDDVRSADCADRISRLLQLDHSSGARYSRDSVQELVALISSERVLRKSKQMA